MNTTQGAEIGLSKIRAKIEGAKEIKTEHEKNCKMLKNRQVDDIIDNRYQIHRRKEIEEALRRNLQNSMRSKDDRERRYQMKK